MLSFLQKTEDWTRAVTRQINGKGVTASKVILYGLAWAGLLFLALFHLDGYPLTWFDEGSHLHVPKALVLFGVYADYSSEGFRYFGPTNGVGATVMLPIAAVFELFGIGLLQARLVMVVYLLAAVYLFFRLADHLGGKGLAWTATLLLIASRGILIVEYGRQVLGEVPALAFLLGGLLLWWRDWQKASLWRMALVGLLFGLSVVTKTQFLLVVGPALVVAWLANSVYYRLLPHRAFIIPGLITGTLFAAWQAFLLFGIDPQAQFGNLALLTKTSGSAAFVFSLDLIRRSVDELLSIRGYFGLLVVSLVFGVSLVLPKRLDGLKWGVLWALAVINLVWYVFASVSWLRYAFVGMTLACLFLGRIYLVLAEGMWQRLQAMWKTIRAGGSLAGMDTLRVTLLALLTGLGVISLALNVRPVVSLEFNAPAHMAAFMNENVPLSAVVETYEPEMGFLTDHRYHFPPHSYLNATIQSVWMGGPSPGADYDFIAREKPDYVLIGEFSTWVNFYSIEAIEQDYTLLTTIGPYRLYQSRDGG